MTVRLPAVAGSFYPADPARLRATVTTLLAGGGPPRPALAVLVPHAGYVYSGAVAGAVFAAVEVPRSVVLLHFDHRRAQDQFALWTRGAWRTPLGDVPVDEKLAAAVAEGCPGLTADPPPMAREHSGEVQLPFLQARNPRAAIVPVGLSGGPAEAEALERFGAQLARVLKGREALVVASSDMNHYEADEPTRRKDAAVIEAILRLDGAGMIGAIEAQDDSMCGCAPAVAMIAYARARGATGARLVRYDTSAATSGDFERVVGYAGIVVDQSRPPK